MAKALGILVLYILVCKVQLQEIEVNTNLQYSQVSYPSEYTIIQNPPTPPPPPPPVPVTFTQPPPPISVSLPPQINIPPPTVTFPPPIYQPPNPIQPPTAITLPPPPKFQLPPPSPITVLPPPIQVNPPPPIAIQELPVSVTVPTVIPYMQTVTSPVIIPPPQIPMISTTVVDNSLANKLANVLQLFLVSKTIESNVNPYSPFFGDVTKFYDTVGTIGSLYSPVTEVVTPYYTPTYGVADIAVPSIFGPEYGTVTEVYPVANVGAVSEVISPFGDYFTYSPYTQFATVC